MGVKHRFIRALGDFGFIKFFIFDVLVAAIVGLVAWNVTGEDISSLLISLLAGIILLIVEIRLQLTLMGNDLATAVGIQQAVLKDDFLLDTTSQLIDGYTSVQQKVDPFFLRRAQILITECVQAMIKLREGEIKTEPEDTYRLIVSLWKQTKDSMFATVFVQTADFWFSHGGGKEILNENLKAIERGVKCTRVFFIEDISDLTKHINALIESQISAGIDVKIAFIEILTSDLLVDMGLFDEKYVEYMELIPGKAEIHKGFFSNKETDIRKAKLKRDRILQEAKDAREILQQTYNKN